MDTTIPRLRFAPSPTGYLHVGGARTALFNWLYARKTGGTFLLRIEDTDKQRSSEEHTRVILDGLTWLGLDWDEEVVFQGARVERHREVADRLLRDGAAYQEEGAIRFRMPPGEIAFDDAVYGHIAFKGEDIRDWVILRSDRTPTYNFSVVVDDIDMRITHVMRGDDHVSNTPKQIAVYRALGASLPVFAHVPMIRGKDGKKLSKRHGATAVGDYQNLGILPGAMGNFLALLGWSPGGDRELFFDMRELIEAFSLDGIQKKSAIFDTTKLEWMNGQHLSRTPPEELFSIVHQELQALGVDVTKIERQRVVECIQVVRERSRLTHDLARQVAIRLGPAPEPDEKARGFVAKTGEPTFRLALQKSTEFVQTLSPSDFTPPALEKGFELLSSSTGLSRSTLMQSVRVAVSGSTVSEPVTVLLPLVGKEEVVQRLKRAEAQAPYWITPGISSDTAHQ